MTCDDKLHILFVRTKSPSPAYTQGESNKLHPFNGKITNNFQTYLKPTITNHSTATRRWKIRQVRIFIQQLLTV